MGHKKFEYRVVVMSQHLMTVEEMNKFGEEGWELIWIEKNDKVRCTFKREKL